MTPHLIHTPNFPEIIPLQSVQPQSLNVSIMQSIMQKEILHIILLEKDEDSLVSLQNELSKFKGVYISTSFTSVKRAREFFSLYPNTVDLIISNIDLSDGSAFSLFEKLNLDTPIMFVSDSENHLQQAYQFNCIDYFTKPLQPKEFISAISIFSKKNFELNKQILQRAYVPQVPKERIVGKLGLENIILLIDDIAAFYTQSGMVYAINNESKRFIVEKKLNELERELANSGFYRINRQYLMNIKYIKGYKPFEKVKLQIALKDIKMNEPIIVSQDYTPGFKKWVESY